jgi:hypothetical protein
MDYRQQQPAATGYQEQQREGFMRAGTQGQPAQSQQPVAQQARPNPFGQPQAPGQQPGGVDRYGVPLKYSAYEREDMPDMTTAAQVDETGRVIRSGTNRYGEAVTHTVTETGPDGRQISREVAGPPSATPPPPRYGESRRIDFGGQPEGTMVVGQDEDGTPIVQDGNSGRPRRMMSQERIGRDAYGRQAVVTDGRIAAQDRSAQLANDMRSSGVSAEEMNDISENDLSGGASTEARFRAAMARRQAAQARLTRRRF